MRDENIGSSQISMNVIFLLNKCHAVSHLQGTAQDKRSMSVCVCVCVQAQNKWLCTACVYFSTVQCLCVRHMNQTDSQSRELTTSSGQFSLPFHLCAPSRCTTPALLPKTKCCSPCFAFPQTESLLQWQSVTHSGTTQLILKDVDLQGTLIVHSDE